MIRRSAPLVIFAVLACIMLRPVIFGGRVLLPGAMLEKMSPWETSASKADEVHWDPLIWDSIAYFYPSRALLGRAVRSGEIPFWNPHQMCGTPFLADYQSAVLYPPNLLFAVLPTDRAFGLLAFLHLIAAGGFTYVFLRGIGLGRTGSTFGGIAFMLSGFAITWLELPIFLSTAVWLPLALHFSRVAHETRSARYTGLSGIALALTLVGGHPQIAFYCCMAVALYWVYLTFAGWEKTSVFRSLSFAVLTFAIGLALAAPQLLPSAELAALSHRGGSAPTAQGYAAYSALAIPWKMLVTLVLPNSLGLRQLPQYAEYCGFVGILSLILSFAAFGLRGRPARQAWFFGLIGVLGMLMALGTGINRAFYFYVPGFARSGSPSRALFLFMFSAAILGGIGLDRMLRGSDDEGEGRPLAGVIVGGIAVLVLAVGLVWGNVGVFAQACANCGILRGLLSESSVFAAVFGLGLLVVILTATGKLSRGLGGALAILILAAELLAFGVGFNPTCKPSQVYPMTPTLSFLRKNAGFERIMPANDYWSLVRFPKAILPPNSATAYGLFDVQGYDSLFPARYKGVLDAVAGRDSSPRENGNMVFARNPSSPAYDLLSVRSVILREPMRGARRMPDGCFVRPNPEAFPRAFLVHTVEYADGEEILRRIAAGDPVLRSIALIDANDGGYLDVWQSLGLRRDEPAAVDRAKIVKYTCNTVTVKVQAARAGILVLTDQFYPGWEARVDGKRANVGRVDYVFRGVAVPAGTHTVRFIYSPDAFERGLRFTKMALVLLVCFGIYSLARRFGRRRLGA